GGTQDLACVLTVDDTSFVHSGVSTRRIDPGSAGTNARLSRKIAVQPYRQYHVSVWIKTAGFSAAQLDVEMIDGAGGRLRNFDDARGPFTLKPTQDWTQYHFVFNSMESSSINVVLGAWGPTVGQVWIDDLAIDEIALVNLLRRPGAPLRVYDAGGTAYDEGADVDT